MLLLCREFVSRVVTIDHETRQGQSARDAEFVAHLSNTLGLPCTVLRRSEIETALGTTGKPSQLWFRRLRLHAFKTVVSRHALQGILLAHHSHDVAETIALRLIRGSSFSGLRGIQTENRIDGLRIWHPLLRVTPDLLRAHLQAQRQSWCEDATNAQPLYARNRIRESLTPELIAALQQLGQAATAYHTALTDHARGELGHPAVTGTFEDGPLGRRRALAYLSQYGRVPFHLLTADVIDRFVAWSGDAANPSFNLPGGEILRRRKGQIHQAPRTHASSKNAHRQSSSHPPTPPG